LKRERANSIEIAFDLRRIVDLLHVSHAGCRFDRANRLKIDQMRRNSRPGRVFAPDHALLDYG
jgi:hypothetical protein